jgi:cell division protein FtsA
MDEIFNLVLAEIQRAGFAQRLNGGVVITGGAAAMQGVAELAADVFGTGVRIGIPSENIGGLADSVEAPRFSTVVDSRSTGRTDRQLDLPQRPSPRSLAQVIVSPSASKPGSRISSSRLPYRRR